MAGLGKHSFRSKIRAQAQAQPSPGYVVLGMSGALSTPQGLNTNVDDTISSKSDWEDQITLTEASKLKCSI